MLWAVGLALFSVGVFGEENATCVADEASEEYPPGGGKGGGGHPSPGKGDGKQPPKQGNPPKEGWPKPPCKSYWSSKWYTSTYTSTPSPVPVSVSSTSSSSATPSPTASFRNGLFFQNLYVNLIHSTPSEPSYPSRYLYLHMG